MRICLLTSSFPRFRGDISGNFTLELCEELASRGFQFEVVAPDAPRPARAGGTAHVLPYTPGVAVTHFTYCIPRSWQRLAYGAGIEENVRRNPALVLLLPLFFVSLLITAWRVARRADLIWSHWLLPAGIAGEIVGRLTRTPHCVTVHSAVSRRIARLLRPLFRDNACMIAVNSEIGRCLGNLTRGGPRPVHTIPMGVRSAAPSLPGNAAALREKHGVGNSFVILSMGRLVKIKGIDTLLRAAAQIPGALLVVAGEGPCRGELRSLSDRLGSNVRFEPFICGTDKLEWLALCDIFVLPSVTLKSGRAEGMPVSLLEALAAGKPVIASDTGGAGEAIIDGCNGILVPPGNAAALEESIRKLLNDRELRERLAANALRSASPYRIESVADRYEGCLSECVRSRCIRR